MLNGELTESVGALVGCLDGDCVGSVDGCDVSFSVVGTGVVSTKTICAEGMTDGCDVGFSVVGSGVISANTI